MFPLALLNQTAAPIDPSLTLALLHFDGADGSTTFTDSSPYNRTVTVFGGAVNSTSQPVFGTSSLYLPNSTSYITLPVAAANFNGSDFCIEMFVKPTSKSLFGNLMGHNLAVTGFVGFNLQWASGSNKVRLLSGYVGSGVWNIDSQSTIDVPLSVNTHLALVRTGQVLRLYIGGQVAIEVDSPLTLWAESASGAFAVGAGAGNNRFGVGYIDEFRIRKEAVYTGNFTPPTAPFTF
jgi:hypothetical protein